MISQLVQKIQKTKAPICVGLDPMLGYIPSHIVQKSFKEFGETLEGAADAVWQFNKEIVDSTYDLIPSVKPQIAMYEQFGIEGLKIYARTVEYCQQKGLLVIGDVKRGDIGSTSSAYAVGHIGKIENVVGMSMEASGGRSSIGDIVMIYNEEENRQMPAEVVGFKDGKIQLMTYEATSGIASGSFVRNTRHRLKVPVGDFLRGRIINALGEPIDGGSGFEVTRHYTVQSPYINPLDRPPIRERLEFGVKAIDGLNTIGKGQRIGIFAGSGVGKSTLMGMIAKNVKTDINVIALVGERGREVLEFVQKDLGEEGSPPPISPPCSA